MKVGEVFLAITLGEAPGLLPASLILSLIEWEIESKVR